MLINIIFALISLVAAIAGITLFILSQRTELGAVGPKYILAMVCLFVTFIFLFLAVGFDPQVCPECDRLLKQECAYCPYCGSETNLIIDCPGCKKEFEANQVQIYCPDCGTKIKE